MHGQINDVIEAIEVELGLNPSGADATVAATLAALPSRYAALTAQWTDYTPTLTAGVAVTKTVVYARYVRHGRLITANVLLTVTGIGTASNPVLVGLPVAAATGVAMVIGSYVYLDAGVGYYVGLALMSGTSAVAGQVHALGAFIGQAPAFTTANTDSVSISVTYEAAS